MNNVGTDSARDFSWEEVGARIRNMRLERGMSQAEFATATNLSAPGVFIIEKGEINPQLKTLQAIAKALGCSVRQLLTGSTAVRTGHDHLIEQVSDILESHDKEAILALLHGLQSAQAMRQLGGKAHRGLIVKPSEEVRRMFEADGQPGLEDIDAIPHTFGRQSSKPMQALRDKELVSRQPVTQKDRQTRKTKEEK